MNLETITSVIYDGRKTSFNTRNAEAKVINYLVNGTVPLQVGLQVDMISFSKRKKSKSTDPFEVNVMDIYNSEKTLIAKYRS